jgi:hypothetical protein
MGFVILGAAVVVACTVLEIVLTIVCDESDSKDDDESLGVVL